MEPVPVASFSYWYNLVQPEILMRTEPGMESSFVSLILSYWKKDLVSFPKL